MTDCTDFRALCADLLDEAIYLGSLPYEQGVDYELMQRARSALAQPAPPAEGKVSELVDQIRQIALAWEPDACLLGNMTARQLARAADLLEHHHPAPVPVSERLPRPEDCDAEGKFWIWSTAGAMARWQLVYLKFVENVSFAHWLPFHALPLPAGTESGDSREWRESYKARDIARLKELLALYPDVQ
jgi:hypothetical protein